MGLDTHTKHTDIAKLARNLTARAAAMTICPGSGINAQNRPTNAATVTDWRLRCQILGSLIHLPSSRSERCRLIELGSGNSRLRIFRAIKRRVFHLATSNHTDKHTGFNCRNILPPAPSSAPSNDAADQYNSSAIMHLKGDRLHRPAKLKE